MTMNHEYAELVELGSRVRNGLNAHQYFLRGGEDVYAQYLTYFHTCDVRGKVCTIIPDVTMEELDSILPLHSAYVPR